jgi:hypothetical protein
MRHPDTDTVRTDQLLALLHLAEPVGLNTSGEVSRDGKPPGVLSAAVEGRLLQPPARRRLAGAAG